MLRTTSPNFKRELKAARIAKGLSGAELCRRIGISEGMMARYESETRTDSVLPNPETLKKINEELFSTTPGTQQPTEARSEQEIANSLPLQVLINAIRRHGGDVTFKAS